MLPSHDEKDEKKELPPLPNGIWREKWQDFFVIGNWFCMTLKPNVNSNYYVTSIPYPLLYNIKSGEMLRPPIANVLALIPLPGIGFACYAGRPIGQCGPYYPVKDPTIEIWQLSDDKAKQLSKRINLPVNESYHRPHDIAVSPDSRYLAMIFRHKLWLLDCVTHESITVDIKLKKSSSDWLHCKFTGPNQIAIYSKYPNCEKPFIQLFDWDADKRKLMPGFYRSIPYLDEFYPSPDGSQWLLRINRIWSGWTFEDCRYFYCLLDANNPGSPLQNIFKKDSTDLGRDYHNGEGSGAFTFIKWMDDKIVFSEVYFDRGPAWDYKKWLEVYDCTHRRMFYCALEHASSSVRVLADRNEFYRINDMNRFEFFTLSKIETMLSKAMTKHGRKELTPFIKQMEDIPAIKKLSRDLLLIVQDYASDSTHKMFQPVRQIISPDMTLISLPTFVNAMIKKLKEEKKQYEKALETKSPDAALRNKLQIVEIDLAALKLFKNVFPKNWKHRHFTRFYPFEDSPALKKQLDQVLEKYHDSISYRLLEFFNAVNSILELPAEKIETVKVNRTEPKKE
ncbi:MAG: hypothetical protein ACYCQI_04580 [Gammaproteobacteria bacterium]